MIEINLLPGGRKKVAATSSSIDFAAMGAGLSARLGDKVLLGSVAVMVLAAAAGGYMYFKQAHDRTVADERLAKAVQDSTLYAGVVAARVKLEAKRDTLLRQVNLIHAIDDDRYIWPHIMDEISRVLPSYTWITNISFAGVPAGSANVVASPPPPKVAVGDTTAAAKAKPTPKVATTIPRDEVTFRITGRTVDIMALTRFMEDLENSPFIGGVYMENTTPGTDQGKELYNFQLTVTYSRPDSTMVRRVPLLLTGR